MWFIIGIIVSALIIGLTWLLRRNNFNLNWYEWLIGIIGFALLLFTVQNFIGSLVEFAPNAAWMFLLVTGLPSLIFLAIAWQLVIRRNKVN